MILNTFYKYDIIVLLSPTLGGIFPQITYCTSYNTPGGKGRKEE